MFGTLIFLFQDFIIWNLILGIAIFHISMTQDIIYGMKVEHASINKITISFCDA